METQIDLRLDSEFRYSGRAKELGEWTVPTPDESNRRFAEETMRRLNEIAHNMTEKREEGGISNRLMDRGGERRLLSAGYKN